MALAMEALSPKQCWRDLIAQANKEMVQEVLSNACAGKNRSLDDIAMAVADRMLASGAGQQLLMEDHAQDNAPLSPIVRRVDTEQRKRGPLLGDIQVAEWDIWSGKVDDAEQVDQLLEQRRNLSKSSPHGSNYSLVLEEKDSAEQSCSSEDEVSLRTRMKTGLELRTTTQQYTWMRWKDKPKSVLLVAKQGDVKVTQKLQEIAYWIDSQGCHVILEPDLWDEVQGKTPKMQPDPSPRKVCWCAGDCECAKLPPKIKQKEPSTQKWRWAEAQAGQVTSPGFLDRCRTWAPQQDKLEECIDLVICVGGDGTLCWASGLFIRAMPPVMAFAGGSLGFLTPFPIQDWMKVLVPILGCMNEVAPPLQVACRGRFEMRLTRHDEGTKSIPVQAMNEVLVHRGSSGHLVKLQVYVNDKLVTMVQGDGLIIATATGSTAYSLAAGGSMMHPAVPGIILTPVCPHSLSFRPVVLPDSAVIKVQVPDSSRNSRVMVAVDGKDRIELKRSDSIEVQVSQFPVPTICRSSVTSDWFSSVNEALQWNLRLEQKTS